MKKAPNKTQKAKKDPLELKDLPVSGGKVTKVKGGATCNTNTITCKESSICFKKAR